MPYALEYTQYMQIPGAEPSKLNDLLLGGLIGIGNMIVGVVIELALDWAGFYCKRHRDFWVLILVIISNLLNMAADIWMTVSIAKGAHFDMLFLTLLRLAALSMSCNKTYNYKHK